MTSPPRTLGPLGATSVVAGSMLGVGILLTPPLVARAVETPTAFLGLWLLGGLVALCGAAVYTELGAMMPEGGGDVVFQRAAWGPRVAAASGLVIFAVAFAGSLAAMAAGVVTYQGQALADAAWGAGAVDLHAPWLGPVRGDQLVGVGIVGIVTALNALGVRASAAVQTLLTLVPLGALAALGIAALIVGAPSPSAAPAEPAPLVDAWLGVYFAYAGWPAVVYVAGEVRDPGRTLAVAMLGGTALVTALYLLVVGGMLAVLGLDGLASAPDAGGALAASVLGEGAGVVLTALVALAILASINGTVLGGGRVGRALARQGVLPARLAGLSPRGVPAAALWAQAFVATVFLLSGTFETIVAASSLAMMVAGTLTVLSLPRLRAARPDQERPFRAPAWGVLVGVYVGVAGLAAAAVGWGAISAGRAAPLAGLGLLAVGWAIGGSRGTTAP